MARIKIKSLPKYQIQGQVSQEYPIMNIPIPAIKENEVLGPPSNETFDPSKWAEERRQSIIMNDLNAQRNEDPFEQEFRRQYDASRKFQRKYDFSLSKSINKYGPDRDRLANYNFMGQKYFDPRAEKLNKFTRSVDKITTAFNAAGALGSYLTARKEDKEFQKALRRSGIPDYAAPLSNPADRFGDYTQFGQFNPRYTGFKSKGTMTNVQYPSMRMAQDGLNIMPYDLKVQEAILPDRVEVPARPVGAGDTDKAADVPDTPEYSSDLVLPVKNFRLSSKFGNRKAPIPGASTNHNGVDLAVPINSEVYAPLDGVVEKIYTNAKGGNQLLIRHTDGSISGYAHLNKYGDIKIGDPVKKGDIVAFTGNTGNSSGPHLHFTWTDPSGQKIDPSLLFNFAGSNKRNASNFKGASGEISLTHNNPLNIHYGDFARKYGAQQGKPDVNGYVAAFPDLNTGIEAAKNLLFSPTSKYYNLSISQATRRWVGGDQPNRVRDIINHIGSDKKLSEMTPDEKEMFIKLSAKWEGGQAYNQIKDMNIYQEGGENNNTMRIRITGTPDEKKMKFGGQSQYGLDMAYQHLYDTMSDNPYEDVRKTITEEEETEDNPHVLEAEGGETIKKPSGELFNISGPRHSAPGGGPKLTDRQAPPGSFIFSDTAKMKMGGAELVPFGKSANSKKKYTPAELSKQYDTNKYLAILKDPLADPLKKRTAQRMLESYDRKLAMLALAQEGKKGFPNGIPKIAQPYVGGSEEQQEGEQMARAQFGGMMSRDSRLPIYQAGNEREFDIQGRKVKARKAKKSELDLSVWRPYTGIPNLYEKPGTPGTPGSLSPLNPASRGGRGDEERYWQNYLIPQLKSGRTPEELVEQGYIHPNVLEKARQYYVPIPGTQEVPAEYAYIEDELPPGTTPPEGTVPKDSGQPPKPKDSSEKPGTRIPVPSYTPTGQKIPARWSKTDIRNLGNAYFNAATLKKYFPYLGQFEPQVPIPIAEDPTRALAQIYANQYLTPAAQLTQYTSPQGLAQNLAFLSGKAMEAGSDQLAQIANRNAQRFTAADAERADILNKAALVNLQNRMQNVADYNTYDAKYRAALRGAAKGITKALNQGDINAANLYNLNISESPYYYIDPYTQMMRFNSPEAEAAFRRMMFGKGLLGSSAGLANVDAVGKQLKDKKAFSWISDSKLREKAIHDEAVRRVYGTRSTSTQYASNPYKNYTRTTGYSGQAFEDEDLYD